MANDHEMTPPSRWEIREEIDEKAAALARRFKGERPRSLCGTCRSAHITKQGNHNDFVIDCLQLGRPVPLNITECNKYVNESKLTVMELAKIARVIDEKGDSTGFYI
jgi:hypothetical protein